MTQYLMAVHGSHEVGDDFGNYGSAEAMNEALADTDAFNQKLQADGYWVFAGGLEPASTATVVDGTGEEPVLVDGPYLETKEHLGGFWIIEADDLDAAREWGAKLAVACRRPIEVSTFEHDDATVQELFEHTSARTK
jgi:hypothetical protein